MKYLLVLACIAICCYWLIPSVKAADNQGIAVSPSIIRLDLNESSPTASLTYTNNTEQTIELNFRKQNFDQLDINGGEVNFLDPPNDQNYRYALASWINFDRQQISLSPNESAALNFDIEADKLSAGAHYAAIIADISQPDNKNSLNINGALSSLIFVRSKSDKQQESATINQVLRQPDDWQWPDKVITRLNNTGDVELIPSGLIEIKDSNGQLVAKGIINEGSVIVLPQSIRQLDSPIKTFSKLLLPGYYDINLRLKYGKSEELINYSTRFWSLGTIKLNWLLSFAALLVSGFILAIYWWKTNRSD